MTIATAQLILEGIVALGVIVGGIGYAYSQFLQGKRGASKDSIEAQNDLMRYMKDQLEGYKEIAAQQDKKLVEMGKEIASMRAVIEEKDKTIEKYLAILQNRNPELEQFMKDSRERWGIQVETFGQILDFMKGINAHMSKHNKDFKIETTVSQKS